MRSKKHKKRFIFYKYLLIYFLVLCLAVLLNRLDVQNSNYIKCIKDDLIYVYEKTTYPVAFLNNMLNSKKLLKKIDLYEKEKVLTASLKKENELLQNELKQLDSILELNNKRNEDIFINAKVVFRNKDYWYNSLTIDKGSSQKVKIGDVVINSMGLIGKVVSVSNNSSVVRLITSNSNKISSVIKLKDKDILGDVSYDKDNLFIMEGINNYDLVSIGDIAMTSSFSSYGGNLEIGKVVSIKDNNYKNGKIISLKSSVDFNDIKYVSVMRGL